MWEPPSARSRKVGSQTDLVAESKNVDAAFPDPRRSSLLRISLEAARLLTVHKQESETPFTFCTELRVPEISVLFRSEAAKDAQTPGISRTGNSPHLSLSRRERA